MGSIYNNGNSIYNQGSHSADNIVLSSALHIGGETQRTLESALNALNSSGGGGDIFTLSDIQLTNLEDGHVLVYNAASGKWINKTPLKIVTWADGTDEEIVRMLEAHYNNEIDITDYWSVGDERTVSLSTMTDTTYASETHVAQNVTMVLLNAGGKELVTPINGHDICAFIVGQKDCLKTEGKMDTSSTSTVGWYSCKRRYWCNNTYKNAIPSTLLPIFKQHYNYVASNYSSTSYTQSADYFCLASVKEVTNSGYSTKTGGSVAYRNAESKNTQFEYYKTSANRTKKVNGTADNYWTDSKTYTTSSTTSYRRRFMYVTDSGSYSYSTVNTAYGIAPYGVI